MLRTLSKKRVNKLWPQVPEEEKEKGAILARVLAYTDEYQIRRYIVGNWLIKLKLDDRHESEK